MRCCSWEIETHGLRAGPEFRGRRFCFRRGVFRRTKFKIKFKESTPMTSRRPTGPVTRALIAALEETVSGSDMRNIERIVDNLVGKALEGELAAIREIFDRVDGKAPSGVVGTGEEEPQKVIFQWKSQ
jgi:hypothetical protein